MAWSQEQLSNARTIYQVGLQVGASLRDIQVAIMAAIVESGLRNLDYGDRDSIGMFQQRDAWGSRQARLDPAQSARMFFLGGNAGQRGLLDFDNRQSMGLGAAAQAVQVSAFPDRYELQKGAAEALLGNVKGSAGPVVTTTVTEGTTLTPGDLSTVEMPEPPSVTEVNGVGEVTADDAGIGELQFGGDQPNPLDALQFGSPVTNPMDKLNMPSLESLGVKTTTETQWDGVGPAPTNGDVADGWRGAVVNAARQMLGTPYVWGGTSYSGVDCSGLIALLYNSRGFNLPRLSADQARSGSRVGFDALKPGDLVAIDNSSRNNGADHIGIYAGNGQVIHSPRPGSAVQVGNLNEVFGGGWGIRISK